MGILVSPITYIKYNLIKKNKNQNKLTSCKRIKTRVNDVEHFLQF